MASKQLNEWLEAGKALSDELANKKPKKPKKITQGSNMSWRKRDLDGNILPQHWNKNRSVKPSSSLESPEVEETHEIPLQVPSLDFVILDQHLLTLRNLLGSLTVPASSEETPTVTTWTQRQLKREQKFRAAMPELLHLKLAAEIVTKRSCLQCKTADAVVRCLDCVPPGTPFLCPACDPIIHGKNVFHDREAMIDGFYRPIPPTSLVVVDESGQYGLCEQVCLLPIPPPSQICFCGPSQDFTIIPGKQTVLVTINGPYNVCLPSVCCPTCSTKWSPSIGDLLGYKYWPATDSCKIIFKFDVFTSFEQMKLASPALSQQVFIKMLEHRSFSTGRTGRICSDTFHRVFREFAFCNYRQEDLCLVEPFKCPACTPDMLAIAVDGKRKHYRFKKSRGTDEPSLFDGLFIAQDSKVSAFVDKIRSQMTIKSGRDVCGPATFTACRETSHKSRAKVDEEGLQIAVCRHGILLQGLNHYRGEIYAYPMFLQKELAEVANATFFCMDVACRYWPYLEKMAAKLPELQPLTEIKPFLSVMHAKAHTGKCEVKWAEARKVLEILLTRKWNRLTASSQGQL
ncbi:uncharacterized protein LOC117553162 isoform X1 [Gymnodraco acuticeps]|uniref:Uncharacterized protein LOC117553162 isoform X1 n=2 Tax=Gymnodraco acuticeps TaxID=8218 RepID=A0A6P8UY70_GYMAC|nr:uncharacterized protein LOC117553162 isoform X1 [Gymnodraco acuticeps]XP_034082875.1 uncharacterized protein LOC117553162 isoform X1 [Gymnodraco acuticeps]XP_034082876.1 uncharacterized protein LOC117553162 isoform X1 [Gymnodraco acuticeps]